MALKNLKGKGEKFFKVYRDTDILATSLPPFHKGKKTTLELNQDDDVESSEEVTVQGKKTTYYDLVVVKAYLKLKPDKMRS